MRKVAYFHKNFIQLTGSVYPVSGEELVIDDRHYLLKPKIIKPQYAIAVFSALVVILMFVIGGQLISPTLPGNGSVIGIILDEDGQPLLSGAEISLPESGKKIISDAIGFFRFDNVATGVYVIQYTLPDGRIGTENISVADDEITLLSLATDNAVEQYSSLSASSQSNPRTPGTTTRKMPPVPKEKKEQASRKTKPAKEYSALRLQANIDGAKLIVNGQVLGAGNLTYKKLAPGKHKAKVTKDGYKAWSGSIRLQPNDTYTLSVNLEKIGAVAEETTYSAEDFYQSGQSMLSEGNIESAIRDFSEAINIKPSMADAYFGRAEANLAVGKTKLAETDLIRAGEIYTSQKRNESALDAFDKALDINNKSVAALLNRGDLYRRMEFQDNALQDYKDAVKYDKNSFRANFELGKMYFAMSKNKDADKRLRQAQEINPRSPEVYHYLMLNYFARDDFNKVKKTYGDFKSNVSDDHKQDFKENPRFDAILRIVGEYERP
jgi:tetratricopeptide (TPR) repeat protein